MFNANHFYLVFNPMINQGINYKTQAHEFYFQLKNKMKNLDYENNFLYWGKIKVNESESVDFEHFESIINKNKEMGKDTHLYISDYHHYWVAKVESVHKEIYNQEQTLSFYDNKDVAIWFKISDMDLISAEFEETLYYISQLEDIQKSQSLTPYLGGLKFPLVVQDNLNEAYFKNVHIEDNQRIVRDNPLIENGNSCSDLKFQVKSFVLPPQVFSKLSHNLKKELLSIEMSLTSSQCEDTALFNNVLNSYMRILESIMNETLGKLMKLQFGNCLFVHKSGSQFSDQEIEDYCLLNHFEAQITIDAFVSILTDASQFGNLSLETTNEKFSEMIKYLKNDLVPFIQNEELISKRQALIDGDAVLIGKEKVFYIRNRILGVGCKGVINKLMNLYIKSEEIHYLCWAA